jgi:asparagine synthetase B (glutamine-hydrolysing)
VSRPALGRVSNLLLGEGAALAEGSSALPREAVGALRGHFALHLKDGRGGHLLARDALGVNKLFFALGPDGEVDAANHLVDLVRAGHAPARVWSVPMGHLVRVWPGERRLVLEKHSALRFADDAPDVDVDLDLAAHAARIRAALDATFRALAPVLAGRDVHVTMSGGLDSTTIAALAKVHLAGVARRLTGVTFFVGDREAGPAPGTDAHFARRAARELGLPLEVVALPADALPDLVDEVLVAGQDYRDFNVHCGVVNAALARAIAARRPDDGARPVVLTGDTMNELLADYTPVQYGAATFYALPRLGAGRLRRFLVSGLDTGDREVGVFAHHGIDTVQPYALCPEVYAALPGSFLEAEGAKQRLARLVMGDLVPSFIYERPKVRAQVGGSEKVGGTLAALVDRGIDAAELERRFCRLLGFSEPELRRWIRAGVYRFTATYPEA